MRRIAALRHPHLAEVDGWIATSRCPLEEALDRRVHRDAVQLRGRERAVAADGLVLDETSSSDPDTSAAKDDVHDVLRHGLTTGAMLSTSATGPSSGTSSPIPCSPLPR